MGALRLDQGAHDERRRQPAAGLGDGAAPIARPFVFRKYLDFGAINAMRDLHAQIRREVARKDMVDHVKLGPGGIREIEFIAQVFQLIRGGRDPALQIRPTLDVLALLAERQLIPAETERRTARSLCLSAPPRTPPAVRRGQADPHAAGRSPPTAQVIARSMDFPDWPAMLAVLDDHRDKVSRHFEDVFSDPEAGEHPLTGLWLGQLDEDSAHRSARQLGFPSTARSRCPPRRIARFQPLSAAARYPTARASTPSARA
jgi:glutamate-ammonia-ligase adenylyltransferase